MLGLNCIFGCGLLIENDMIVGGYCILIDFFYLMWKVCEFDFLMCFIEFVGEVNNNMLYFCCLLIL